jgi:hypothetical protein
MARRRALACPWRNGREFAIGQLRQFLAGQSYARTPALRSPNIGLGRKLELPIPTGAKIRFGRTLV